MPLFLRSQKKGPKRNHTGKVPKRETSRQDSWLRRIQNGEVRKGDSVDNLESGWELNPEAMRAESVFRESPEIKQILYFLCEVPGQGQLSGTLTGNALLLMWTPLFH